LAHRATADAPERFWSRDTIVFSFLTPALLARRPWPRRLFELDDQRVPARPDAIRRAMLCWCERQTDSGLDWRIELMEHAEAGGALSHLNHEIVAALEDFHDPSQEWRRLFSELLGTFFLVLVAAGGGMMGQAFPNTISRTAAVVAPGLREMAIILFMGKVSGAHLNPAVSIAFSLRGDFPWRRVPGYMRGEPMILVSAPRWTENVGCAKSAHLVGNSRAISGRSSIRSVKRSD
jgi:hypothetical protein